MHLKQMRTKNLVIGVLVVAAILLWGYQLAKKPTRAPIVSQEAPVTQEQSLSNDQPIPYGLSAEEAGLLGGPPKDATEEEQDRFLELARKVSQNRDAVVLSNCAPQPFVLQRTFGDSAAMQNNSSQTVTINIEGKTTRSLAPHESAKIASLLPEGRRGLAGYACFSKATSTDPNATTTEWSARGFILTEE